jgi:hypothetical protein
MTVEELLEAALDVADEAAEDADDAFEELNDM